MSLFKVALVLLALFSSLSWASDPIDVSDYQVEHLLCGKAHFYAFRSFIEGKIQKYVVVNTLTLKSSVVDAQKMKDCAETPIGSGNPYFDAVNEYTSSPEALGACQGFKSFPTNCSDRAPLVLTTDLCPSNKPALDWEKQIKPFLENVAALKAAGERGTPIVFSATGLWLEQHQDELKEIEKFAADKKLDITWANHSYDHGTLPRVFSNPRTGFLTQKTEKQFKAEVLDAEKVMLQNGLTPSPFFRFPGLFSTDKQVYQLRDMGMIPLNTSAWLALKNTPPKYYAECGMGDQRPGPGKVILVHSNGNEPAGIALANTMMDKNKAEINFISLQQAVRCDVAAKKVAPAAVSVSALK